MHREESKSIIIIFNQSFVCFTDQLHVHLDNAVNINSEIKNALLYNCLIFLDSHHDGDNLL